MLTTCHYITKCNAYYPYFTTCHLPPATCHLPLHLPHPTHRAPHTANHVPKPRTMSREPLSSYRYTPLSSYQYKPLSLYQYTPLGTYQYTPLSRSTLHSALRGAYANPYMSGGARYLLLALLHTTRSPPRPQVRKRAARRTRHGEGAVLMTGITSHLSVSHRVAFLPIISVRLDAVCMCM